MTQEAVRFEPPEPRPPRPRPKPFHVLAEWLCRRLLRHVRLPDDLVQRIDALAEAHSLVYVMRYRSWVDYALVTYVLMRAGLPVPVFANGATLWALRPVGWMVAALRRRWRQRRLPRRELRQHDEVERCRRLVRARRPVLIFMRGPMRRPRLFTRRRRGLVAAATTGRDFLREIVHDQWTASDDVALVPLAVIRGRGLRRKRARNTTLVYPVQDVPGEVRRLVSLLWNLRETGVSVGGEVTLRSFIPRYQHEGEERAVRRLARLLLVFLYREERVVWGPPLRTRREVRQRVLQDRELAATVSRLAQAEGRAEAEQWHRAERMIDEIAANFNGIYFSILEFVFNRIWPRIFHGIECQGLEKVAARVRQHPVVLVPSHRSHFDYLILSYLFHVNYLSPPHIAAGINLAFWPLGPLFRGAGAYFIRRSFEGDELYTLVFRKYLTFLITEGYTQEFFIEGGRSRTGKMLRPRFGLLSAMVDAFLRGARRDLYFVPVSIHYGRVVEEGAYQHELGGGAKPKESLFGLLRARQVLQRRYGTVSVTFADPISLDTALGAEKDALRPLASDDRRRRKFVEQLSYRLLREINQVAVAGATAVSATVLLSLPTAACRRDVFVTRARTLARFLHGEGVRLTASLERNLAGDFSENLAFLQAGGLVSLRELDVIHVPEAKRLALDFYKNGTLHFFLLPALLRDAYVAGTPADALEAEVAWWLRLLRFEFPLPEPAQINAELARLRPLVCGAGDVSAAFRTAAQGLLDPFRQAYWIAAEVAARLDDTPVPRSTLVARIREHFHTALLLGEVSRPEGASAATLTNAVNRYVEYGFLRSEPPPKGREPSIAPGPAFAELAAMRRQLATAVRTGR